jgi:hypothetical protein
MTLYTLDPKSSEGAISPAQGGALCKKKNHNASLNPERATSGVLHSVHASTKESALKKNFASRIRYYSIRY